MKTLLDTELQNVAGGRVFEPSNDIVVMNKGGHILFKGTKKEASALPQAKGWARASQTKGKALKILTGTIVVF